jgi:hypothetical protein
MPSLLTSASTMTCPHGGMITAVAGSVRAQAGAPILRGSDTFVVAGCPFVMGTVPSPCVSVQWIATAQHVLHGGEPVLAEGSSVGLCLAATQAPQGVAMVVATQSRVAGS